MHYRTPKASEVDPVDCPNHRVHLAGRRGRVTVEPGLSTSSRGSQGNQGRGILGGMNGETDLATLLATMSPQPKPGRFVYAVAGDGPLDVEILASVAEPDGSASCSAKTTPTAWDWRTTT